jgi:hypothetical protein
VIIEQRITDLAQVDDLGDNISRVSIVRETRKSPEPFYARTSDVTAALDGAKKQVDALDKIDAFQVLNPACDVSILTDVPPQALIFTPNWRSRGGLPGPFAAADGVVAPTPETLFRYDHHNDRLVAFTTNAPVSIPFVSGGAISSAEYWDLPALADLLEAHPWVKQVFFDAGRPSGWDHIPASLSVLLVLPQDVYEALQDIQGGTGRVSDALFFLPRYPDSKTARASSLGTDPLGIASALRTDEYEHPGEEWDYGPSFPALEKRFEKQDVLWQ